MKILKKMFTGFLYGLGFAIPVSLGYYFASTALMSEVWDDEALGRVTIESHRMVERGSSTLVLGSVLNRNAEAVRLIVIKVDLFDKNGDFVDQCSRNIEGGLKAGEKRNFKVSCGSDKSPVAEHQSYKLFVIGL